MRWAILRYFSTKTRLAMPSMVFCCFDASCKCRKVCAMCFRFSPSWQWTVELPLICLVAQQKRHVCGINLWHLNGENVVSPLNLNHGSLGCYVQASPHDLTMFVGSGGWKVLNPFWSAVSHTNPPLDTVSSHAKKCILNLEDGLLKHSLLAQQIQGYP